MSGPSTSNTRGDRSGPGYPVSAGTEKNQAADSEQHKREGDSELDSESLEAANAKLNKNLQELTSTYQGLEDAVSVAETTVVLLDVNLRVKHFTRRTRVLFGLHDKDREQAVGSLAERLNYPDLEEDARRVLREAHSLEAELLHRDRWYSVRLRPDLGPANRVDGVAISLVDVTRRKRAEISTQRARLYAEKIVETIQEPIVVLSADLCIKSANRAFYEIFQHQPETTEGKLIYSIGEGQWDCPKFRELLEKVLPNNEYFEGFELSHDFAGIGTRTLLLNICRLDEERLILLTVRDITLSRQVDSLRHRESSLMEEVGVRRRLQEMASAVLQSGTMQEMFDCVMDASAELSSADFGVLQTVGEGDDLELVAQHGFDETALAELMALDQDVYTTCTRALREHRRVSIEDVHRDKDFGPCLRLAQEVGFRALDSTPLVGRSGKVLGVLTTYYREVRRPSSRGGYVLDLLALEIADLVEWSKTEKRLRQSETRLRAQSEQLLANDRQKNQFLGLLGHELRNPLTVMRNSIQTLATEEHAFVSDPRISESLALLERQSRHMTHLVNDLLDITRINNGKVVLKRERVSLPRCLEEVLAAHRPTLFSRQLTFSVDKPDTPIYLDADAARLFQVLDNLLTNAIKFTQPGGSIHVAMEREGGRAIISVEDSGIGIPAESINSLFDPFTQVDNNLACHGLGLGLSLVDTLVSLHGGEINAYSEGDDKGSEFVVHWPLHKRQADPAVDAAPPELHAKPSISPQRILVVDDIPDIADSFARLLEVAGHQVIVAYDAEQGLSLAREHRPTVAFLDIVMPETDGLQLAQRLRHEFHSRDLTLVVVSGYGQSQDIERARAAGFEHHLLKPIEVQQVYELLDSLAGGQ